jgi:hypothetical protein
MIGNYSSTPNGFEDFGREFRESVTLKKLMFDHLLSLFRSDISEKDVNGHGKNPNKEQEAK